MILEEMEQHAQFLLNLHRMNFNYVQTWSRTYYARVVLLNETN